MAACAKLLRAGDSVIEVGTHIGYLCTYFAHLVGPTGRVLAFEPSEENARYLRENVSHLDNVTIDSRGISNFEGEAKFFVETLTGQNNSLYQDYAVFDKNAQNAGMDAQRHEMKILVTTLDSACAQLDVTPNFIKIDIEGAEYDALRGMIDVLKKFRPIVLIEITMKTVACFELFESVGYQALDEQLKPTTALLNNADGTQRAAEGNFFFVPPGFDGTTYLN